MTLEEQIKNYLVEKYSFQEKKAEEISKEISEIAYLFMFNLILESILNDAWDNAIVNIDEIKGE